MLLFVLGVLGVWCFDCYCFAVITIYSLEFFTSVFADGLSLEFECQQVFSSFQDFLSILTVLNNAVVWMVLTRPPNSKSSSPFYNPLGSVPKPPISIIYYYYYYCSLIRAFHISDSRWFFTEV